MLSKQKIGERLKKLREANNEKQTDISNLLNVQRQIISYYETGSRMPNVEDLAILAEHFNTSVDYLLGITDVKSTEVIPRAVSNYIGLDEDVIKRLHEIKLAISEEITDDVFAESFQEQKEALKNRIDFYNFFLLNDDFLNAVEYSIDYKDELSLINASLKAYHYNYRDNPAEIGKKMLEFITDEAYKLYRSTRLNFFEATEAFKKGLEAYTKEEEKQYKNLELFLTKAAEIIAQELKEGE